MKIQIRRFRIVRDGLYGRTVIIQPMWAIDEQAMIFLCLCLVQSISDLMSTEIMVYKIRILGSISSQNWNRIYSGAFFQHVRRIRPTLSLIPCVTSDSHEQKGANHSLIAREIKVIIMMMLLVSGWNVHSSSCLKFIMMESKRSIEVVA